MNGKTTLALEKLRKLKETFQTAAQKKPPSNPFLAWLHHHDTPQETYSPYVELTTAAINRIKRAELEYADVILNGLRERFCYNVHKFSTSAKKLPRRVIGVDKKKTAIFAQYAKEMENIIKLLDLRLGFKLRSMRFK